MAKSPENTLDGKNLGWNEFGMDGGTWTGAAGAVTVNKNSGVITTESLATAAASNTTYTVTLAGLTSGDVFLCQISDLSNSVGSPAIRKVVVTTNTATLTIANYSATVAFSGTFKILFQVVKQ